MYLKFVKRASRIIDYHAKEEDQGGDSAIFNQGRGNDSFVVWHNTLDMKYILA